MARRLFDILTRPRGPGAKEDHIWWVRLLWVLVSVGLYLFGWFAVGEFVASRGVFLDVSLPLDERIPLRVGWGWGYTMIWVLVVGCVVVIRDQFLFVTAAKGVIVMTLIGFVFFIAVPVKMVHRPDPAEFAANIDGINAWVTGFYYFIDPPLNCFPSMHLALGVWSAMVMAIDAPKLKWIVYGLALWVGISVLFVRQHYILDVVAGTSLALACRWWWFRDRPASTGETRVGPGVAAPIVNSEDPPPE